MTEWFALNQQYWNERAARPAQSDSYAIARFVKEPDYLSDVVRLDRERLGAITGRRLVHLQCHIGTDTLCCTGSVRR